MKLKDSVVFITGANRGLGLALAREALARGAKKVYAAARDPASVTLPGVTPIQLDVTDAAQVAAAAKACGDVTLLVNNAGIAQMGGFLQESAIDAARKQMETNYFGPLHLTQAFAPVLAANGGGAIVNVLSVATWVASPVLGVYGSTKAAAWGFTNSVRHELRAQGTQVLGLHVGFIDTDLVRGVDAPKTAPEVVAQRTYEALEAGADEVLADEKTQAVKNALSSHPAPYLQ